MALWSDYCRFFGRYCCFCFFSFDKLGFFIIFLEKYSADGYSRRFSPCGRHRCTKDKARHIHFVGFGYFFHHSICGYFTCGFLACFSRIYCKALSACTAKIRYGHYRRNTGGQFYRRCGSHKL